MGSDGAVDLDEAVEYRTDAHGSYGGGVAHRGARWGWIVISVACLVFVAGVASPPHLMDDVDAVQAQIARNMLVSGDWVTAQLDGVPYLEKAPLPYWIMEPGYPIFGIHDWSARLPLALATMVLCWVV